MDRRESFKTILVGGITGSLLLTGCEPDVEESTASPESAEGLYGRTEQEKARDARVKGETFFTQHEIATIAVLCDLILPATATAGSATDAGVPEFIEFIVKDITAHQTPVRGGLMWLDNRSSKLFEKDFASCSAAEQTRLLDEIAWPDKSTPETEQGIKFFSRMRNLVLTGYYTTRIGIEDLGYKGNVPNVWDGVPEEVLRKHELSYDPAWLEKCVDQDKRDVVAEWDDAGNLLT